MYSLILRMLFILPPETAHHVTMRCLHLFIRIPGVKSLLRSLYSVHQPVSFAGITFKNRVGMAAGFDKNAQYLEVLEALGFGYVEIGTVTPRPQPGNDKPRMFRLPADKALINRMGFNNDGVKVVAERLRHRKTSLIVGGNIGKNKNTPNEEAVEDYAICFRELYTVCDYFVINVSSPNTPGLRALQDKDELLRIINRLMEIRTEFTVKGSPQKPLFLKIAPDLTETQIQEVVTVATQTGLDGLIATNTTISRDHLITPKAKVEALGAGGLSGAPLTQLSNGVLRQICQNTQIPVIATGGVMNDHDAREKMKAGAGLIQIYTGFIYAGPSLIRDIARIQ